MPATADRRSRLSSLRLLYVGTSPERVRRAVEALDVPTSDTEIESVARPATALERIGADASCVICDAGCPSDLDAFHEAVREVDATLPILFLGDPGAGVPSVVYGDDHTDWVFRADDDGRRLAHRLRTALRRREYATDEKVRFLEASLNAVEEVFYLFDLNMNLIRWNEAVTEITDYDDAEIEEMPAIEFIAPEDRQNVLAVLSRVVSQGPQKETASVLTKDGERIPHEFTGVLLQDAAGDPVGICGIGRDISDRRRRQRELAELDRVNAVVRDVNRALARASTREEIERAVCDRLAAAEPYRFVWIGEYDASTDLIAPTERTGAEGGYLDEVSISVDADGGADGSPSATAYRTGEVTVVQDIASSQSFGPWRSDALDRGYASVAAVPLTHGGATYGVLHVYADRTFAFDDREVDVLADLGETIGSAIASVERRRALAADTTTELTFRFGDRSEFLVSASARTGAAFDLRGSVPRSDGGYLSFVDVEGGDPAELRALADDDPTVEHVRVLTERDGGGLYEFVFREQSAVETLADRSAVVRSLTVEDGDGRVVAAVADRSAVRTVAEAFRQTLSDAELLAKRERARSPDVRVRSVSEVSLTDRQRASLEAAYRAGFFDEPRRSSGAEIADSLGVSPPTFHSHLRAAERKLARTFFNAGADI